MKKLFISLIVIASILVSTVICTFAAVPATDGTYEVTIQLRRADSDASAEGSSFLSQKALLEVKNGKKYLTMVSLTSAIGFNLYYYTDGSVSGDTAAAEIVKNIKIGSTTYPSGYKIPVNENSQLVGVMIKIPYTSATVSGRIYIDYNSCKLVSEPETSAPTDKPETTSASHSENDTVVYEYPYALKNPGSNQNADYDYNYSPNEDSDKEATSNTFSADKQEKETSETKVVKNVKKKESNTGVIIGGVILGAILLALVGWVVISKAKESK